MLKIASAFVALSCTLLASSYAAGASAVEQQLNAQYHGKKIFLRHSFKSGSQEYDGDGQPLKGGEEGPWTLYGTILVRKISVGTDALHIEGNRIAHVFEKDANRETPFEEKSVKIKVHLKSPLTSADQANAVLGLVFAVTLEDIVNSTPSYWREFMKKLVADHPTLDSAQNAGPDQKLPSTQATVEPGAEKSFKIGDAGLTPPKLLYKPEPEFSDAARNQRVQGVVGLNVIIDSTGRVRKVSIAHAVGMGLDEKAIESVEKWRFSPATKDGVPVAIAVYIEVDYHLYERR